LSLTNTFNTFWKSIEKNGHSRNKLNANITTKNEQKINSNDNSSQCNNENQHRYITNSIEGKDRNANKVLEVLMVELSFSILFL
jgi:hypothetical protein